MKKIRRTLAIAMAVTMAVSMLFGITASANPIGSIVITPPSTLSVNGVEFRAFKVFDLITDGGSAHHYILNPAFAGFNDYPNSATETLHDYIRGMQNTNGDLDPTRQNELYALARALWRWSEDPVNISGPNVLLATGTASNVTFSGVEYGYYLIAGSGTPTRDRLPDELVISMAMLATVNSEREPTQIALKADVPEIKKYVSNHHVGDNNLTNTPGVGLDGLPNHWQKWTDVSITDEVQFLLRSTVPNTLGYQYYSYQVHDRLSRGLTYDRILSVTAVDTATTNPGPNVPLALNAATNGYTLDVKTRGTDGYQHFTVQVNSETILRLAPTYVIEIVYVAILNENAVIEDIGNPNYVYLEYSNNPNYLWTGVPGEDDEGPTGDTPDDDAWVYTYRLRVFKFAQGPDGPQDRIPLANAEFELWLRDSQDDLVAVAEFNLVSGVYVFDGFVLAATDDSKLVSNALGEINIDGLDEGTYSLVEIAPPAGYYPLEDPVDVVIKNANWADPPNGAAQFIAWLNLNRGVINSGDSRANGLPVVGILNVTGAEFPSVGGMGRTLFMIAGVAVMGSAIVGMVITTARRKKRTQA